MSTEDAAPTGAATCRDPGRRDAALEPGRRLLHLPDGGPTLRPTGGGRVVEAWAAVLAGRARLPAELVPHADDMVALGVPDNRPDRLPGPVAALLHDDDALLAEAAAPGPLAGAPGA